MRSGVTVPSEHFPVRDDDAETRELLTFAPEVSLLLFFLVIAFVGVTPVNKSTGFGRTIPQHVTCPRHGALTTQDAVSGHQRDAKPHTCQDGHRRQTHRQQVLGGCGETAPRLLGGMQTAAVTARQYGVTPNSSKWNWVMTQRVHFWEFAYRNPKH